VVPVSPVTSPTVGSPLLDPSVPSLALALALALSLALFESEAESVSDAVAESVAVAESDADALADAESDALAEAESPSVSEAESVADALAVSVAVAVAVAEAVPSSPSEMTQALARTNNAQIPREGRVFMRPRGGAAEAEAGHRPCVGGDVDHRGAGLRGPRLTRGERPHATSLA
jgi:hypothetical protein